MDHLRSIALPFRFENGHLYMFSSCLSLDTNCCHSGKKKEEIEQNNDQNEKEKRKQTKKKKTQNCTTSFQIYIKNNKCEITKMNHSNYVITEFRNNFTKSIQKHQQ